MFLSCDVLPQVAEKKRAVIRFVINVAVAKTSQKGRHITHSNLCFG
jgi:hypothetical protein